MKIPARILDAVRGPALAVAVAGCSSTPAAEPEPPVVPEPAVPVAVAEPAPDPVAYDAVAETERYRRADALASTDETRREQRIADEAAERRRRAQRELQRAIGAVPPNQDWLAACGRG